MGKQNIYINQSNFLIPKSMLCLFPLTSCSSQSLCDVITQHYQFWLTVLKSWQHIGRGNVSSKIVRPLSNFFSVFNDWYAKFNYIYFNGNNVSLMVTLFIYLNLYFKIYQLKLSVHQMCVYVKEYNSVAMQLHNGVFSFSVS